MVLYYQHDDISSSGMCLLVVVRCFASRSRAGQSAHHYERAKLWHKSGNRLALRPVPHSIYRLSYTKATPRALGLSIARALVASTRGITQT